RWPVFSQGHGLHVRTRGWLPTPSWGGWCRHAPRPRQGPRRRGLGAGLGPSPRRQERARRAPRSRPWRRRRGLAALLRPRDGVGSGPGPSWRCPNGFRVVGGLRREHAQRARPRRRGALLPGGPAGCAARRLEGGAGRHQRPAEQLRARRLGVLRLRLAVRLRRHGWAVPAGRPRVGRLRDALCPRGWAAGLVHAREHPVREGLLDRVHQDRAPAGPAGDDLLRTRWPAAPREAQRDVAARPRDGVVVAAKGCLRRAEARQPRRPGRGRCV
ncbi:unnamed protein product, partial [Prorocentrum cordatum]